jgi:hypothetical protein
MLHGKAANRGLKIHTVKTDNGFAIVAFTPEDVNGDAPAETEQKVDAKTDTKGKK